MLSVKDIQAARGGGSRGGGSRGGSRSSSSRSGSRSGSRYSYRGSSIVRGLPFLLLNALALNFKL